MASPNNVRDILKALEAGKPGEFTYRGRVYTYKTPTKAKKAKS